MEFKQHWISYGFQDPCTQAICNTLHRNCDTNLRTLFQYNTSSEAVRFLTFEWIYRPSGDFFPLLGVFFWP